ncbi:MAG: hypothetical protein D8M61_15280 [Ignavibacteriae bacterium]|nr:hypothetical protein [Ignavibacteriota bacterium]
MSSNNDYLKLNLRGETQWQDHSNVHTAIRQIQIGKDTEKHKKVLKESEYVETVRKDLQQK